MKIRIRQERPSDRQEVHSLIEKAFAKEPMSDHREQFLVDRLRKTPAFVPGLSLVAERGGGIEGHILLTRIHIVNKESRHLSLALAPVSVLPESQHKGIGGQLIRAAHERAKELGFDSVMLLGHEKYYPRFGYRPASLFGITFPFKAPDECCLAIELIPGALKDVSGMIEYPPAFFE